MKTISIVSEPESEDGPRFRAVSGDYQSTGRTMGEALDALTETMDVTAGVLILIQKRQPDAFFSAGQHRHLQKLRQRRELLTNDERTEWAALVDDELDATVARTADAIHHLSA